MAYPVGLRAVARSAAVIHIALQKLTRRAGPCPSCAVEAGVRWSRLHEGITCVRRVMWAAIRSFTGPESSGETGTFVRSSRVAVRPFPTTPRLLDKAKRAWVRESRVVWCAGCGGGWLRGELNTPSRIAM